MSSSLYNSMGRNNNPMSNLINHAREFRKTFTGNPRQEVERLLQSGQMSQKTFNELSQIAQQVVQLMVD